jgi:type VII secretion-associated serine protease mycosin
VLAVVAACALTTGLAVPAGAAPAKSPAEAPGPLCGPTYPNQLSEPPWPLRRLEPSAAWPVSRGTGVVVAVIDSGVSRTHPKLDGKVLPGLDLLRPGASAGDCDDAGHGTMVAAIIAGRDTRDAPFSGIAPDAMILPVRVLLDDQKTPDPQAPKRIAQGIVWAVDHGATVINLSLETSPIPEMTAALEYARGKDVVLVAAAGNEGATTQAGKPVFPANAPGVIAVGGIDQNGKHVSTSNVGDYVDVAAPGFFIEAPAPRGNGYMRYTNGGSSFAAAYVSGVAALTRAYDPTLSAAGVARRITLTADPPPEGHNIEVGAGVVNPYRAVATVLDPQDSRPATVIGEVPPSAPPVDPLNAVKVAAGWAAFAGLLLAVLLLLIRPAMAAGRRRRQPGDTAPATPAPARVRSDFTPLVGRTMSITSPSVQRVRGD